MILPLDGLVAFALRWGRAHAPLLYSSRQPFTAGHLYLNKSAGVRVSGLAKKFQAPVGARLKPDLQAH
jgi:hypothetical protein